MYSGVCIGGPMHGQMMTAKHSWFQAKSDVPIAVAMRQPKLDDPREAIALEHFTYLHSEEYTEWGNVVRVFIWDRMGALPQAKREKFIATALTGEGKARKPTKANREILWPGVPDYYWR